MDKWHALPIFSAIRIAGIKSEVLMLGMPEKLGSHQAIFLSPDEPVSDGAYLNFIGSSFEENEDFNHFLGLDIRSAKVDQMVEVDQHHFALLDMGKMGKRAALVPGMPKQPESFIGKQVAVLINLHDMALPTNQTFNSVLLVAPLGSE